MRWSAGNGAVVLSLLFVLLPFAWRRLPWTSLGMVPNPGPLSVAVSHLEVAASPRSNSQHGVLASVWYPTPSSSKPTASKRKWMPGPDGFYAQGLAEHLGLPWPLKGVLLPALVGTVTMDALAGDQELLATAEKLPVVVMSHGVAGWQTLHSTICGALASYGFVVLAVEHRDGSAAIAARNNYTDIIEYQTPTDDIEFRQSQLDQRVSEVLEAFDLLKNLHEGRDLQNLLGTSIPSLEGRLDLTRVAIAGHSFGGSTAFRALMTPDQPFAAGIIIDPGMSSIRAHDRASITAPILSVHAEVFHSRANLQDMRAVLRSGTTHARNAFVVLKGTTHRDFTDVMSALPDALRRVAGHGGVPKDKFFGGVDRVIGGWLKEVMLGRQGAVAKVLPTYLVGQEPGWIIREEAAWEYLEAVLPT
ncbi:platelet-activating factor acetylhydrolase, isoform II-domain-containing protein [Chytriomyces sp. MP71]|nr:platelet-activating factor acetylhydrolase, isoform II-domain-containing protein [Chytriomyces sp. MP71]